MLLGYPTKQMQAVDKIYRFGFISKAFKVYKQEFIHHLVICKYKPFAVWMWRDVMKCFGGYLNVFFIITNKAVVR